jgi:hypothetical protein
MATSAATMIAAMAAKARREVREHFQDRKAFDRASAIPYDPPDSMHRRQMDFLLRRGILQDTPDDRYWIDMNAVRREEERRKAAGILALKIIIIAVFVAIVAVAAAIAIG